MLKERNIKERLFDIIIVLFVGIMFTYLLNKPPTVVVKYPIIDKLTNVHYIDL
jgi:hypothetical protein